jgi:hypothetical protein
VNLGLHFGYEEAIMYKESKHKREEGVEKVTKI